MIHRLQLVTHAPTSAQREARFPTLDEAIDPLADDDVRALRSQLGRVDRCLCSPERRTAETALALGFQAERFDALMTWSAGRWAGQTVMAVAQAEADAFAAWRTNPESEAHGGESLNAFLERVAAWLDLQVELSGHTLIVAGATFVRAALMHALGAGIATFWRLEAPPLSLSVIQSVDGGEWRVRGINVVGPE
jgi:broad specificity phosphatase PhoE